MKNAIHPAERNIAIQEVGLERMFEEMAAWSKRISKRAYEFFAESGFTDGHDRDDWFKAEQELLKPIALDVKDKKDEFVVTAKVPGFDAKDFEIHVNDSRLVIEGKHETEEKKDKQRETIFSERVFRMIELPAPVVAEKAHAELKNGVLELRLPKAGMPRQINVAAA